MRDSLSNLSDASIRVLEHRDRETVSGFGPCRESRQSVLSLDAQCRFGVLADKFDRALPGRG